MTEIAYPFDTGPGATVKEAEWQRMAREWLTTGVLIGRLNQLAVTADGSALAVTVASGSAWIDGTYYRNDAAKALPIGTADPNNPRIDRVIVRVDHAADTAVATVLQGTPGASPTPPALTQTDAVYELLLADVAVPAAAGVIVAGNVTDRRVLVRNLSQADMDAEVARANAAYVAKTGSTMTGTLTIDGKGVRPVLAPDKPAADAPSTYPLGFSQFYLSAGLAAGWPVDLAIVTTYKEADLRIVQHVSEKFGKSFYIRGANGDGTGWDAGGFRALHNRVFTQSIDFPSIPANSSTVVDVTATADSFPAGTALALLGVNSGSGQNGLIVTLTGTAPAANTIRFVVKNHTGAAIDPAALTIALAVLS
jgi:hypothetical protein